jgi:beta-lactamase regulating signal transducer with metallopeptidase domain/tetratricopeptide (TPR) repeat protein
MNHSVLTESPGWTAAGWTMLHLVWVGAAIGLLAACSRRFLKSAVPEARHVAAIVWLLLLAGSPVVVFLFVFEPRSTSTEARVASVRVTESARTAGSSVSGDELEPRLRPRGSVTIASREASRGTLEFVVPYLPVFWLAGSCSALVMLATGLIGAHRMRRSSRILETGEIRRLLHLLADSLGIVRDVTIGISDRLAAPVLVGIVRPLILLPASAVCGWNIDQLEMVLLHELAHLRRWDNVVNLVQRIVESLLFFHPVVWWLSGWVRLERELCCDRLVVSRVDQPFAYAEMLVALAGPSYRGHAASLAMADRQVMTRIRRLFNLEDRSMKLTVPEGIGLVGAVIVGASLMFGLQAAQPQVARESEESVRQALRSTVQAVLAVPQKELKHELKPDALANIAQAQMKLGDRNGALETLQRAYESIGHFDAKKKNDMDDVELLGSLTQVAKHQREAGDQAAAKKTLDRMVKLVDSLQSVPFVDELIQITGTKEPKRKKYEMNAFVRCELLLLIAEEQLALGDRDPARATCQRALRVAEPQNGMLKPMVLAAVATSLHRAGDAGEARKVIQQSRRLATELPDREETEGCLSYVAQALAQTGDFDAAFQLAKSLGKYGVQGAIRKIVDSFTEYEPGEGWLRTGDIKLTIGADSLKIEDLEAARIALPKLVQFARGIGDPLTKVRTLSMLAHLQAKAGDFAGANRAVEAMPSIKRKDYPGPSDGFYDAVKPCTLAIIAKLQFDGGEKASAGARLLEAKILTGAIEAADQKVVSQIVIVRKLIDCNDLNLAGSLLRESLALAQQQPEPLRSRSLAMLALSQHKAGDAAGAILSIRSIRNYPGLEKVSALNGLADVLAKNGDRARAQSMYREALACMQSPKAADAAAYMGKEKQSLRAIAAETFVDYKSELPSRSAEQERQMVTMFLYMNLGDIKQAVKLGLAMRTGMRDVAIANLAGNLAGKGELDKALGLAKSFETAEQRLMAYDLIAVAIRDGQTRQ